MHIELPVVSFISAFLVLIPLPWYCKSSNVPAISISLWLFIANIVNGINSVIWADNTIIVAPVWCDIVTKILVGTNVAIPTSIFCLCAYLERASLAGQSYNLQKRRILYINILLCLGVPIVYMILHSVVQAQRFDIVEGFGCRANIYNSVPSIFLLWIPPLVFSLGACIVAGLALRRFWINRIVIGKHLQASAFALTTPQYFRLMSMAFVQILWSVYIASFNIWLTVKHGLRLWISWSDVHSNFSHIGIFPTALVSRQEFTYTLICWWTIPITSLIFFVFALGEETMEQYGIRFSWFRHCSSWLHELWLNIMDRLPMSFRKQPPLPTHLQVEVSVAKFSDKLQSPQSPKFPSVYPVPLHAYIPKHALSSETLYY